MRRKWLAADGSDSAERSVGMETRSIVRSAVLVGVGVAALLDGVVFHQLLQWHHMLSGWHKPTTSSNLRLNTTADGWFHVATLAVLVCGVLLMFRTTQTAERRPPRGQTIGALILGGGGFNFVEGVVDHQILGVHHVREGASASTYDAVFLAASLSLCLIGAVLLRDGGDARHPAPR